jgi:glycosyltransferase involved in cell wall biosynthesis
MNPEVSIVILNYEHPEIIDTCLKTIATTTGISYEVIVVDNGSSSNEGPLQAYQRSGLIDRLVTPACNTYFSEGNNIGVSVSSGDHILLLNSDVAVRNPLWLSKLVGVIHGGVFMYPDIWNLKGKSKLPDVMDILSVGWTYDPTIDPEMNPEGWCCLFRKEWWRDLDQRWPFHGGFDYTVAQSIREGAKCGVLWNYHPYIAHRECASEWNEIPEEERPYSPPTDKVEWYKGLKIYPIDFVLTDVERVSLGGSNKLSNTYCTGWRW